MSHLVSKHLLSDRAIVFSEAMVGVLSGQDRRMRVGDVMESTADLFARGKTLDGIAPAGYEIGQWKGRYMCDDEPASPVDGETYVAWVSADFWGYDPNLVFLRRLNSWSYSKTVVATSLRRLQTAKKSLSMH